MVCSICNSKQINRIGYIHDFEYDLKLKAHYNFCNQCCTVFKSKKKKLNYKKIYPKNYVPTGFNPIFNVVKNLYSYYEFKKIDKIINFKISKKILELGCGNGFLINKIAKNYKNSLCLGVDLGIKNYKSNNLTLINEKFENLKKIKKFNADIIILNNVIEHFENFKFIKKFFSILGRKTIVVILTPDVNSNARKSFSIFWSGYHSPRHNYVFSIKSFKRICKSSNLKIKYFSKIFDPFTNFISLKNFIKAFYFLKNNNSLSNKFTLPLKIFDDILKKNRLFLLLEKI